MNRSKAFVYNTLTQATAQFVAMVVGFIIPRVMLSFYGSEINGLVTSITQILSYFNLVEAGISSAAVYALYKPIAVQDIPRICSILSATKRIYRQSGIFFLAMVIIFALLYPLYIKVSSLSSFDISILIIILGINEAFELFVQGQYKVLLTASQRYFVISFSNILYYVVNAVIFMVFANAGANIIELRLVAIISLIIRASVLYFSSHKLFKNINFTDNPDMAALNKRWDALILQILGVIQSATPVLLLTLIVKDLRVISVFSIYALVIGGVSSVAGIFTTGLSSSFGDVIARGEKEVLQKSYRTFETAYYILITIVFSCTVILVVPFIKVYTKGITDADYVLPITGVLFCLQAFLHNLKTPQGMLVHSAGLYKETRWQTMTQAGIAIVFGSIFAFLAGLNGVIIGFILSEVYRLVDLVVYISRTVTKLKIIRTAKKVIYNLCVFLFASVISFFIKIDVSTYFEWCIIAIIVLFCICAISILTTLIFNKSEFFEVFSRVKSVFGRR